MDKDISRQSNQMEVFNLEKRIKSIQLWTAIVIFLGAVMTTFATWLAVTEGEKKTEAQIRKGEEKTTTQLNEIKSEIELLLEKPLEGLWNYHSDYIHWYDEKEPHELIGSGKAFMIWKKKEKRYDVYLTFKITRSVLTEFPLLVLSVKGIFNADTHTGWPKQQNFTMDDFEIVTRMHYKNLAPTTPVYKFTDCNHDSNNSEKRVETIKCILATRHSKSKVTFTRLTSLH